MKPFFRYIDKVFRPFLKFLKNKYILAALLFFVWLLFFDQNNLVDRLKTIHEINQFEKDKQ